MTFNAPAAPQDPVTHGRPNGSKQPLAGGRWFITARTPRSVAHVRRYCVAACEALGWADAADTVELLVSEIATNAVCHAQGQSYQVRLLDQGKRLRVEVADDSPERPASRDAAADAENGRGLAMVNAFALRSGVEARGDGKTTWFEVGSTAPRGRP